MSFLYAFCPHSYTPENTFRLVTHPKIALDQTRLTHRFFRDMLPKKYASYCYEYSIIPIKP